MGGGIAVRGDMVAIAWSAAKGHVFLVDGAARRPLASWRLPDGASGWSDAAGVALDERYHVYVADPCNDRVLQFDPFGRLVRSYGAPAPARGDAGRDRAGVLDRPHAVAVRGDVVWGALVAWVPGLRDLELDTPRGIARSRRDAHRRNASNAGCDSGRPRAPQTDRADRDSRSACAK